MSQLNDPPGFLDEHYVYEVNMCRETYRLLASPGDMWNGNALMEAFAIHARCLLDFYGCQPKTGDDVVASEFTPTGTFTAPATSAIPADMRRRINKQIPHLTSSREGVVKIGDGDRNQLLAAIEADHAKFKAEVKPEFNGCFTKEQPSPTLMAVVGGPASATNQIQTLTTGPTWP